MQLKCSVSASICATVRSTPLIAIESPGAVPSSTFPQAMTRRPRSASRTLPTSSMMPVNMGGQGTGNRGQGGYGLRAALGKNAGAGKADDDGDKPDDQHQPQGNAYGPPARAAGATLQLPAGPSSQRGSPPLPV